MLDRLVEPMQCAQLLTALFLAVLFLQSGVDKVVDFNGNLSWLKGHFSKSPLAGQVKMMLVTITMAEIAAGALALAGAVQMVWSGESKIALLAAELSALDVLMLFFGQRIAKEYAGAAALVPYFVLAVGAILLFSVSAN
jgi:hypothetical protein